MTIRPISSSDVLAFGRIISSILSNGKYLPVICLPVITLGMVICLLLTNSTFKLKGNQYIVTIDCVEKGLKINDSEMIYFFPYNA